jgi:cytochrome c-type biogenesis protein
MNTSFTSLLFPAFIAGILTFLAPCTLPLLPGYIGFLGGTHSLVSKNENEARALRKKVLLNASMYILGFSLVFIALGSLFSIVGLALGPIRLWLTRIGGVVIIFFGLYLLGLSRLPIFSRLAREERFHVKSLTPGNSGSSFLFGAAFAFGWTPCIGPILGTVLLLASTRETIGQGVLLLVVFSLGLAIPFFLVAVLLGSVTKIVQKIQPVLGVLNTIGGVLLVVIGAYLLTNNFALFTSYFSRLFDFLNYQGILNYL